MTEEELNRALLWELMGLEVEWRMDDWPKTDPWMCEKNIVQKVRNAFGNSPREPHICFRLKSQ